MSVKSRGGASVFRLQMDGYNIHSATTDGFMRSASVSNDKLGPDLSHYKGCVGGKWKTSYVISAPLHPKGIWEFWSKNKEYKWLERTCSLVDVGIHLALWSVPLFMEIWGMSINKGNFATKELQLGSMWSLITALIGLIFAQLFALMGQETGKLFPTTYAAIIGGGYASIIFSILYIQQSMSGAFPEYTDNNDLGDKITYLRHTMLWGLVLKICAVVCAQKNANFWGPATTDTYKERQEQLDQWKSDVQKKNKSQSPA